MADEREKIQENIRQLESFKASGVIPPEVADASIAALKKELATYDAKLVGSGAIAQGENNQAVGPDGIAINGGVNGHVLIGDNIKVNIQNIPQDAKSLSPRDALRHYLDSLIAEYQLLRLQGIRAGSQPLSVSLEKVYVSLTAIDKQSGAGGERDFHTGALTIGDALKRYRRLVIIGDPGCGKTTLLSYIALTYARALLAKSGAAEAADLMQKRLQLDEPGCLPILLPLRALGRELKEKHTDPGKDGPTLLLKYLFDYFANQQIALPPQFFDAALTSGKAVLLLDGMDEVADTASRQRVARIIEKFAGRYPACRFVVTSREVGYEGAARIGAEFGLAKVRDFSPAEVRQFIRDWTRVVETTLAGSEAPEVVRLAEIQAGKLIQAVEGNQRVAELAVNPLLLTVIALVHRYRAQLPERRSELYEEAVEVLLGHWDEAKPDMAAELDVAGIKLDSGDRRSLLEPVAFWMHERKKREIELDELRALLEPAFRNLAAQPQKAVTDFLKKINERSGLLVERGVGMYGFAHLTFQEYLAARELAGRKDALAFTLKVLPDPWWREVILLQAGYLSAQGKRRVSELIAALMDADPKTEPEPHHHLLLAAECLFDVGNARVEGDLLGAARNLLQKQADAPFEKGDKAAVLGKITASNALTRLESGKIVSQFWKPPYGEPEWITIPAGEFWMGGEGEYDGKPVHKLSLPAYQIARVPVTNAQYAIYVKDSGAKPPEHWRGGNVPPGLENHPVTYINWHDALAYCQWLSAKIEKPVTLPSEAEWEKAAKGPIPFGRDVANPQSQIANLKSKIENPQSSIANPKSQIENRSYPWGNDWKELHCNSSELGLDATTPVGLFLNGASPYGLLDMSGNVWEWTRSVYQEYPSGADDGREDLKIANSRVVRGGAWNYARNGARCAFRSRNYPDFFNYSFGFRVCVPPGVRS